jgi:hypothetical protein
MQWYYLIKNMEIQTKTPHCGEKENHILPVVGYKIQIHTEGYEAELYSYDEGMGINTSLYIHPMCMAITPSFVQCALSDKANNLLILFTPNKEYAKKTFSVWREKNIKFDILSFYGDKSKMQMGYFDCSTLRDLVQREKFILDNV